MIIKIMKKHFIILILIALTLSTTELFSQSKLTEATDFNLMSTEGLEVNLFTELDNDKTVLLSFFSTTCLNCVLEAPKVDSIYQQFGSNNEQLLVWGIAPTYSSIEAIEEFIAETEISYPCFPTAHADDVFSFYNILYTPQIYIVCDYAVSASISFLEIVENLDYCFPTKISKFEIYPNIFAKGNELHISNSFNESSIANIYDITGRLVKHISLNAKSELVINDLNPGYIYIVNLLSDSGQTHSQKVFIQ